MPTYKEVPKEDDLRRLLYLSNIEPKYFSGGERYIPVNERRQKVLDRFLIDSIDDFLNIIKTASDDRLLPHRYSLYSLLASALVSTKCKDFMKPKIAHKTVLATCKSDQDLFDFIKYVSILRTSGCKMPTCVGKMVRTFYKRKTAVQLAQSYAKYKRYHCWSHKDLIKLGHVKTDTPLTKDIVKYILFKNHELTNFDDDESREAQNILIMSAELRRTTDPQVAVPLIIELRATINQVEPSLRKSAEVWNAVLPNMTLSDVLQCLPKLYQLGFLKRDTPTLAIINARLLNSEDIRASGIHPVEVFIHMKNFEKGGKPADPKLLEHLATDKKLTEDEIRRKTAKHEPKCPQLIQNLQKCMTLACGNVQPTNKRYLVTIDVTDKMDYRCINNKNITSLEAAVAFTMALLKVEKDVIVAVFREREISLIQLDRRAQFYEHVQKLRQTPSTYSTPSAPIDWARIQRRHIDVFYNFVHHKEFMNGAPKEIKDKFIKPSDTLRKYRNTVGLPNSKLITFAMASPHVVFADGSPNMVDVVGLDMALPRVVEAFCRGNFC